MYGFGRRKDEVLQELKQILQPFGIERFYPDHWGAYARQLEAAQYFPGKRQRFMLRQAQHERKILTDHDPIRSP